MSRYFNSFMDDSSEDLEHSWGTSPKAKAREKEYNHWYYQKHKDELAAIRKQRHAATNSYKQAEKSYYDALTYKAYSDAADSMLYASGYPGLLNGLDANSLENDKRKYRILSEQSAAKSKEYKIQGARQKASAKAEAEKILRGLKNPTVKDLVEFYLDTTVVKAKKSASKAANKAKKYATKAVSNAEKSAKKYATKGMSTAKKYATKAVSNAEKSAKKYATKGMSTAKKYATKGMFTAEKYATKAISTADKYATKAVSNAEKSARKAKKYATKTIKSAVRKAKKYVKE